MNEEFNLSKHIENALNIYKNVKNAKNNNSTGCYVLTSKSEFIHLSFIQEFIKQLKKELLTCDTIDQKIWKINQLVGDRLI